MTFKIATIAALISGGAFFYLAANIWFLSLGFRRHWGWGTLIFLLGPVGMVFYYLTHLRSALGSTLVMLMGTTMFICGGIYAYDTFPARDQIYALSQSTVVQRDMPRLVENLAQQARQIEIAHRAVAETSQPPEAAEAAMEAPPEENFQPQPRRIDPDTLVGLRVDDVKLKLGKPIGQMSLGIGFVLLYPEMELTSRDGKTITFARRVAK